MAVPASRYQISARSFPEVLPSIDYGTDVMAGKVQDHGKFPFTTEFSAQQSLSGIPRGAATNIGRRDLGSLFCAHQIAQIDARYAV